MRNLTEIRADLDAIDRELRELFLRRLQCSQEVAAAKGAAGSSHAKNKDLNTSVSPLASVCDAGREGEILSRISAGIPEDFRAAVQGQFREILRNSRALQYRALSAYADGELPHPCRPAAPKRVILQGAEGSYQQIAASRLFPGLPLEYCESFEEVFERVDGESTGILPLENSTAGMVADVFDGLYRSDLYLSGSLELSISHALLGRGSFEEIDTVLSHPQALRQCAEFLRGNDIRGVACTNNAIAAKMVSESDSNRIGAICSEDCARIYRLRVLRRGVSDRPGNTTRFVVLSKRFEERDAGRLALFFRTANRPGALSEVLAMFALRGINVLALHSRPIPESPFEYCFYVEFAGSYADPEVRALLLQLKFELPCFRLLGSL